MINQRLLMAAAVSGGGPSTVEITSMAQDGFAFGSHDADGYVQTVPITSICI
jgi:hypothetical protein